MFCRKCGNELSDNARFCNKCGEHVERIDDLAEIPEMTLEESISFLEKLKFKYSEIEKMERTVADNESNINRPLNLNYSTYSFFRFFWKYLVFAALSFVAVTLFAPFASISDTAFSIFIAMWFITPITVLIIGVVLAAKRRNEENNVICLDNERAKESRKKLEKDTIDLKNKLAAKKREVARTDSFLPEDFRKSSSVTPLLTLLRAGKVSNIREAIEILRK